MKQFILPFSALSVNRKWDFFKLPTKPFGFAGKRLLSFFAALSTL
jgi:hypothetical protein